MTETITLNNNGQRTIHYGKNLKEASFKPKDSIAFPVEIAARLQKLYPDEVVSSKDAIKAFAEPAKAAEVDEGPKVDDTTSDDEDTGNIKEAKRGRPAKAA